MNRDLTSTADLQLKRAFAKSVLRKKSAHMGGSGSGAKSSNGGAQRISDIAILMTDDRALDRLPRVRNITNTKNPGNYW